MKALWQQAVLFLAALASNNKTEVLVAIGGMLVAAGNDLIDRYTAKAFGAPAPDETDVHMAVNKIAEVIVALGGTVPACGVGLEALKVLLPLLLKLLLEKKAELEDAAE